MIDRAALLARREMAQARLRRAEWSSLYRSVAPLLCAAGMRFAKRPPAALVEPLRFIADAPGRDERLYWPDIAGGACRSWSTPEECAAQVTEATRCHAAGDERILVVFHDREAAVSLAARDLTAAWPHIHAKAFDLVWIVAAEPARWVVEASFLDRDVCHAADVAASSVARKGP